MNGLAQSILEKEAENSPRFSMYSIICFELKIEFESILKSIFGPPRIKNKLKREIPKDSQPY